ncbi:MAG: hypothetical protein U5L11_10735 [Arhodomonas sp.]|nr:hypothetical protein [Arhodomonas sp.]
MQRKLRENSQRLLKTREQKEELDSKLETLPKLEEQAKQFKQLGLEQHLQQVPKLERERQLRSRFLEELSGVTQTLPLLRDALPDLAFLDEGPSRVCPMRRRCIVPARFSSAPGMRWKATSAPWTRMCRREQQLQSIGQEMEQAHQEAEKQLDKEFKKLPEVAGQSGREVGQTYQKLLRRIEETRPLRTQRDHLVTLLGQLEAERRQLRGRFSDLRNERTRELEHAAKQLNRKLRGQVRVEVTPGGNRRVLKDFLCRLAGIGEGSIGWVDEAEELTVPALVEAIDHGPKVLRSRWGLTPSRAETLCRMAPEQRLELETIDLKDQVNLELNISHEGVFPAPGAALGGPAVHRNPTCCSWTTRTRWSWISRRTIWTTPSSPIASCVSCAMPRPDASSCSQPTMRIFPCSGTRSGSARASPRIHGAIPAKRQGSIDVAELREEVSQILEGVGTPSSSARKSTGTS